MRILLSVLLLCISSWGFTQSYTGQNHNNLFGILWGDWDDTDAWTGGSVPSCGTNLTITIPAGVTMVISGTVDLSGCDVDLIIEGVLSIEPGDPTGPFWDPSVPTGELILSGNSSVSGGGTMNSTFWWASDEGDSFFIVGNDTVWVGSEGAVPASTLPIDLIHFAAEPNEFDQVEISWATASEINNKEFVIQRTVDGKTFEDVLVIDGAGTSFEPLEYKKIDKNPLTGDSYYRLKQIDFDGQSETFDLVHVYVEKSNADLIVYPNPTEGKVVLNRDIKDIELLQVLSPFGADLTEQVSVQVVSEGTELDFSALEAGTYLIKVNDEYKRVVKE